jgi:penicillin-binding protein 1A
MLLVRIRVPRRSVRRPATSSPWTSGVIAVLIGAALVLATSFGVAVVGGRELYRIYADRDRLPELDRFIQFEFPTTGQIFDANGELLVELADEYRDIVQYAEIPPVVRDAILAAEDKRFFEHDGVDYRSLPRVFSKVRVGALAKRLTGRGADTTRNRAIFPQGGSTITQQLVRGVFLQHLTSVENSHQLRSDGLMPRAMAAVIGARNVNKAARKREELRLSLWLEQEMRQRFGSKRRAKEEILARYASFVYMGHGQHGFARAATHYFGKPLATFTAADVDKAALLAGIPKAPRDYAPADDNAGARRRRDQVLALMAANGSLSPELAAAAQARPLPPPVPHAPPPVWSSAVVEHVLDELGAKAGISLDDLRQGQVRVYATVDGRVQRIVSEALERGLERYEQRHPKSRGVVQGAAVVLKNSDGSILAETGGRQVFRGRDTTLADFNRARQAMRQPGSTMKPFVYLAAFDLGGFTLESLVPDEPISVPDGAGRPEKWIANYDGQFRGLIPVREALAESRNAVAVWMTTQIGIDAVLRTASSLGVRTRLQRYATTSLGASEVSLLELATAYRTIASGVVAHPFVVREVVSGARGPVALGRKGPVHLAVNPETLALIQEGLRGVVRMPTGTAHALTSRSFPIPVMGKTGTTNDFKDALFVGSTYGLDGITVAVRIGFDDGRSLGSKETGGRLALPVFRDVVLRVYQDEIVGKPPAFPRAIERRITEYLTGPPPPVETTAGAASLVTIRKSLTP